MLTSGELLFQNSEFHNVGCPDLAETWAPNCVFSFFFLNKISDSYCKYSEKIRNMTRALKRNQGILAHFSLAKGHRYLKEKIKFTFFAAI